MSWILKQEVSDELLKFDGSVDFDGYVPVLSQKTQAPNDTNTYQFGVETVPGHAKFEAIAIKKSNGKYNIPINQISRTDKYSSQIKCLHDQYKRLNKFCYCK